MRSMEAPAAQSRRPRRIWRWLAVAAGVSLAATAMAAFNAITLTRDAATLRDELISTFSQSPRTQVQVTVGPVLLATARAVIGAIDGVPEEARIAMRAVRNASVGVYKLGSSIGGDERGGMFSAAEEAMQNRGWTRVVAVSDRENVVLVFLPAGERSGSTEKVCIAVCSEDNLIVVQGTVRVDQLVELAMRKNLVARR